jgi:ATP-binding cassette, subfamily B, bacterial
MSISSPGPIPPDPTVGTSGVPWGSAVGLGGEEAVVATAIFDLDAGLRFTEGFLCLTDRRLIADPAASQELDPSCPAPSSGPISWPLDDTSGLDVRIRGGVGRIELSRAGRVVARWLFSLAQAKGMHALKDAFEERPERRHKQRSRPASDGAGPIDGEGEAADTSGDAEPVEALSVHRRDSADEDAEGPPPNRRASWRMLVRLAPFARPYLGPALLGLGLSLVGTVAALLPPYLTMPLVDRVLIPRQAGEAVPFSLVAWYLGGLVAAAIAAWILSWAQTWVLAWVSERVAAELRVRTYAHMQSLSLDFFAGKRTGDLISRISNDTDQINVFLSVYLISFISDCLLMILTAGVLVWLNPALALVTLVPFPLVLWLVYGVRKRLQRGFSRSNIAWAEVASVLADTIPGIRVVKAFAQEGREIDRFRTANNHILEANDRVNTVWSFFGPLVSLFNEMGLLVVWAAGAWMVFQGSVTVGGLTAFLTYIARFYARVESMVRMVPAAQRAAASAQRLFEILDCRPTVAEDPHPVRPARVRGRIELSGVHFRYGTREILHGIDLVIEPGEMIGLVGSSGSGKSTLANLVCRFFDPSSGTVSVDGTDLRRMAVSDYRRNLGCVLQEPLLFFGSVAENIAYGCPDAGTERVVAAARAAGAHEFILSLPNGYDSRVGERGGSLSGGERQRISIARALLVDPAILILDEATSAVDAETEVVIQSAIDRLVKGRTTIAIAHRLSTLRRADRLVVLDAGRIVEIGTHDELLSRDGAYSRLYHAQSQATAEAAAEH